MNPTTKTADTPESLKAVARAENSLGLNAFMEYAAQRKYDHSLVFPLDLDTNGNQFINTDHFALEGLATFTCWLEKVFWTGVKDGKLGLNPRKLFQLDAPPQTAQSEGAAPVSGPPSSDAQTRTTESK
jgi:hypothetical protein